MTDINIFSSLKSYMDLNKRLNLAIPKPAGPLAPYAMLIIKNNNTHKNMNKSYRNRSSSSTSLPKNLSTDVNSNCTDMNSSTKSHKSSERTYKTTHSASFKQYKHIHDNYNSHNRRYNKHKCTPQHYRYRYNKRRAAQFNKLKKGKSEYTTHHVVCNTSPPNIRNIDRYPDSIHSYGEDKCLSVPPLTPMLRANSANTISNYMNSNYNNVNMGSINHGRPYSKIRLKIKLMMICVLNLNHMVMDSLDVLLNGNYKRFTK